MFFGIKIGKALLIPNREREMQWKAVQLLSLICSELQFSLPADTCMCNNVNMWREATLSRRSNNKIWRSDIMKIPSWAQNGLMSPEIRISVVRAKKITRWSIFRLWALSLKKILREYFFIWKMRKEYFVPDRHTVPSGKTQRLRLSGYYSIHNKTRIKSQGCFGILSSLAFQWALKLCDYHQKWLRKLGLKSVGVRNHHLVNHNFL